jgi:hypothetical protein
MSLGIGSDAEQYGNGATATSTWSVAIGSLAKAHAANSVAIGRVAAVYGKFGTAIGSGAGVDYNSGVAVGYGAWAANTNTIAIGTDAQALDENSIAIGNSSVTDGDNQFVLGNSAHTIIIPGQIASASQTNSYFIGTNAVGGDWSWEMSTIADVAAGNNTLAPAALTTYVFLSGNPAAAFSIAAITGGRNGRMMVIENGTGYPMTIAHQSGFDGTATRRIITAPAADITVAGRDTALLIYNSTSSRWILISPVGLVVNAAAQVLGAGTDYSLGTTITNVDFGTTDPTLTLPSAGTYQIGYDVGFDPGATGTDTYTFSVWDGTSKVFLPGSTSLAGNLGASLLHQVSRTAIYAATNSCTITLHACNGAGARGTVTSTNTALRYVRLY